MERTSEARAPARQWSYFNVLEMLVAAMPPGRYTADIGEWTRAIKDLQDHYQEEYPGLFDDIYFIESEPLNPYSAEMEEFFQRIALVVYNPNFDVMEISDSRQDRLRARAVKRLRKEDVKAIEEMSRDIATHLRAK